MKRHVAALIVVWGIGSGTGSGEPPVSQDRETLQGRWEVVQWEFQGKDLCKMGAGVGEFYKSLRVEIKDDQMKIHSISKQDFQLSWLGSWEGKISLTVNDGRDEINIRPIGSTADEIMRGIYKFDEKRLIVAVHQTSRGSKRPTTFKTTTETEYIVVTLQHGTK